MTFENDLRQYAPATRRNRDSIFETLVSVLPPKGNILEIASGTGEHAVYFAPKLKNYQWIPSEPDAMQQKSIDAWREFCHSPNCQSSLNIDVLNPTWTEELKNLEIIAIVNINMIHISPWEACLGLIKGAGNLLPSGGILYLYGPYKQGGKHTAPSNQLFDESLRIQNQAWGVRNLEDVINISQQQGLKFVKKVSMPANNLSVIFKKN
ncbi:hypothetical protein RGRSB_1296 [cyanobacterium endosymbiont of Rhopalodia gibberula]|uniref:DUF938 domain-containing protein n=1 Tax=cyanobacterium endosymbiont of Rhopalodia gibberula TaxID=1763363 RepID=UPI000DC6E993|nr:DUF938 domain-containing protein [cyanobacterium endosymbiont of Rhopalodia gibberula]BBA79747.1 hypothetical protein RGRSB_1296 [cyanobacterium endosymbiont of Rhopalodia gibberula]